jgi:site-specific DNA-cytosine methylase
MSNSLISDIVLPEDRISSTFTKSYGTHNLASSGSLLSTLPADIAKPMLQAVDFSKTSDIPQFKLRYFTPLEISRLHAIPDIKWPDDLTDRQKYQLLGNGLNVQVVYTILSKFLLI